MRKHINRLQTSFLLVSLLALAACGGGGGGSPIGGGGTVTPGDTGTSGVSAGITEPVLSDDSGAPISSISFVNGASVSFTVTDSDGNAVNSGNTGSYTFAISGATTENNFVTGAGGIVTFDLIVPDPSVSGTGVLTIVLDTDDGEVTIVREIDVELVGGVPAIINLVLRDSLTGAETVDIAVSLQNRLFIEVTDALGNPVADQEVNLSSSNSLVTLNASVRTEADGTENILVTAADEIPAGAELSGELSASVSIALADGSDFSLVQTAPFEVVTSDSGGSGSDPVPGIPASLRIVLTNSVSGEVTSDIRTDQDSNLFVEVLDGVLDDVTGLGTPVADVEIQIETTNSLISFNTSVLTEANGQENILIDAAAPEDAASLAGTITVTALFTDENGASSNLVQSLTFEVIAVPVAGEDAVPDRISFVSADPETIAIQGAGGSGRSETSVITFQVFDAAGLAVPNVEVDFNLDSTLGGIELLNVSDTTDAFGEVTVTVKSGNQPTQVSIEASFSVLGEIRSASSEVLVIEAGPPQQDGFSLATSVFNPGGNDFDGITTELTVSASDAFSNQIPDGTAVLFRTEYGRVDASCVTSNGVCTAEWRSQNPRGPLLDSTGSVKTLFNTACEQFVRNIDGSVTLESTIGVPCSNEVVGEDEDLGQIYGGRTTVLATAFGNEAFIDANSNGFYDSGELFEDLPEAFLDDNEDGAFGGIGTVGSCEVSSTCPEEGGDEETFIDINVDGNYSAQDGIYNGTNCSDAAEAAGDCSKELVTVRASTVIHMGGSVPYGDFFDTSGNLYSPAVLDLRDETVGSSNVVFKFTDVFNGHLPEGTTIDIDQSFGGGCFIDTDEFGRDFTVPNTSDPEVGKEYEFSVVRDNTSSEIDVITLNVEIPAESTGGTDTEYEFSILCVTDPDADLTAIGSGTDSAVIGLALSDLGGSATTQVTDVSPGVLTINLTDSLGVPISDVLVTVETTVGEVSGNGVVLVSGGTAQVNIIAGADEGGGSITVTFGSTSSTVPFEVVQTGGVGSGGDSLPTVGLQLVDASTGAATRSVSSTDSGRVIVTLNDTDGVTALPFELVTVTTNLGELTPSTGSSVLTDATGVANFGLAAGSGEVGTAGTITAVYEFTVSGFTTQITETFNFEIGSGDTPSDLLIDLQDSSGATIGAINSTNPGVVVVTVQDIDGIALADQIVNVTTTLGALSPVSGNILTNALGEATIDLSIGTASAGEAGTLTATLDDLIVSMPFEIAAEAAVGGEPNAIGLALTDSGGGAATSVAEDAPGSLIITVSDELTALVPGQTVTVTTSLGALVPASGIVLTDAAGVATIQILADGEEVGSAGTVTVVAGTVTEIVNFEIAASAGGSSDPFAMGLSLADSGGASTTTISSSEPGTLTVTLTDSAGDPVASEIINVSSDLGLLVPASGNIRTDALGQATIDVQAGTADAGEGGTLTATFVSVEDGTFVETFTFDVVAAGDVAGVPVDLLIGLEDTLGATISSINSANSGVVVVTVQDFNGDPIADQIVNITSTLGDLSPASGNVLTNALGEATIALTAGTASAGEAGTLTATLDALTVNLPFEIAADAAVGGEPNTVGLALADSGGAATTSVADDDEGTLTITVLDELGTPVVGEAVTVTTSLGALTPVSGVVLTDAITGVATIQILADGAEVGSAGTVTVVAGTVTETVNFDIAASAGGSTDPYTLGLSLADSGGASTTIISSTEPGTLTVTLIDSDGFPAPSEIINITSDIGLLVPASGNIRTDALGQATIDIQAGTAEVGEGGTLTATYVSIEDGTFVETFTFDVVAAGDVAGVPVDLLIGLEDTLGATISSINSANSGVVVVTVQDFNGDPVADQIVNITSTLGDLSPASGNVLTNALGEATIALAIGTASAGEAGTLTATLDALTVNLPFDIAADAAVGGEPNTVGLALADSGGGATSSVAEDDPGTLTITVLDDLGAAVVGDAVTVTTSLGALTPSAGIVLTDALGQATIQILADGAEVGAAGTVTVVAGTITETINFEVAASAGGSTDAFTLGLALSDPGGSATTSINSAEPGTMTITLADSAGAVVSGQVVNLSTTLGVLVPGSGNVLTDGAGQASVQVQVGAADVGEAGILTATYVDPDSGDSFIETFTFEVVTAGAVAGEPSSLTILLEDPDNVGVAVTSISDSDPAQLRITVLDSTPAAVAGTIVSVSTTLGEISPASGNVLTDASGEAIVDVLVGGGDPGEAGTLTVTIGDLTETLNFEIVDSGTTSTAGFSIAAALYTSDVDLDLVDLTGDIVDPELANRVSTVNSVESGIFVVYIEDAITGLPIGDAIVTVSADVGELTPSNGRILTNSDGIASATVGAGTDDPGAAGTLTATLEDVEAAINFSIGNITLSLGFDANGDLSIDLLDADEINQIGVGGVTDSTTTLAPTGSTSLSVTVVDDTGAPFTIPLTVNFSSACSAIGDALIDTGITTVNGEASATYEATGCAGPDEITATVAELSGVTANGSLTVADADANSIQFISATPSTIALLGTGGTGRQEFSTLVFEVIDEAGDPISGELVSVDLSTTLGGVNLTGDSDDDGDLDNSGTDERLTSNASGQVSVIVNSGTVPTSVRVTASITLASGDVITTVSDSLVVSTGLPDQNSFSLAASLLSPGGFNFEGIASDQTVRAADAFNNPVPDGTTINFTTEYGRVDATCTTVEGDCVVEWNSQDPRGPDFFSTGNVLQVSDLACDSNFDGTADLDSAAATVGAGRPCPILSSASADVLSVTGSAFTSVLTDSADTDFPGQIFGGRSTILAYAIGEESFVDANGNGQYDWIDDAAGTAGVYDPGVDTLEAFVDLSEAFLDHNEDGVFGNGFTSGACTGVGTGNSIVSVVDVNDINENGNTTETVGEALLCASWQEGGAEEEFIDFNVDGIYDRGNGIYNGTLCDEDLEVLGLCTTTLVSVREDLTLVVGGSDPFIAIYDTSNVLLADTSVDITVTGATTRRFYVSDIFNGRLPAGTNVSVEADNCRILGATSFEVGDSSGFGNHVYDITVDEDTSTDIVSGVITFTVTTPDSVGGVEASSSFSCVDAD